MSDDVLLFFAGKPGASALYRVFEDRVMAEVDGVRIRVQKTQISFYVRHMFAAVSLLPARPKTRRPETYITVTIGLRRRLDSPRVDRASPIRSGGPTTSCWPTPPRSTTNSCPGCGRRRCSPTKSRKIPSRTAGGAVCPLQIGNGMI